MMRTSPPALFIFLQYRWAERETAPSLDCRDSIVRRLSKPDHMLITNTSRHPRKVSKCFGVHEL